MNIKHTPLIALTAMIIGQSCGDQGSTSDAVSMDTTAIRTHLTTLSSDEFQGRKPFTEGERKTIEYISNEFANIGLQPGNGESYFQEVPLVELTAKPSEKMTVSGKGANLEFQVSEDFVVVTERVVDRVELKDSELVFAGYGITAPEYGWNDYDGIDWKGKTAVVLVNDPGFSTGDSTLFKGKTMTYYGRWTYKYEEAARQGADGVLIIHETVPAAYGWRVVKNSWSGANLYLEGSDGNMSKCAVEGWVSRNTAIQLFETAGLDMKALTRAAKEPGFKPVSMGLNVSVSIENDVKKDNSQNVIGILPGTEKSDEYLIYTAHWDHLGVGIPDEEGDSIYNGALDNASGMAEMLVIADAFIKRGTKPKRSIVFLAVTAEEQGLLGSAHYAQNPIYPIDKTIANINMDGSAIYDVMKDLTITGYGHSDMDEYAKEAAEQQGRYIIPDPEPGKGYFFRSDHFNFAKVGIPALYAKGNYESMTRGVDYVKKRKENYVAKSYHRPSDEFSEDLFSMEGIARDAELLYNVGSKLADGNMYPKWYSTSEFSSAR